MTVALLTDRLANREVILMDGATGTELEKRGVPMHDAAWSIAAVETHPDVVRQIHADYIRAGADIIITNTFSTSRHLVEQAGLGNRFVSLNADAAKLACQARADVADRPIVVAGSISTATFFKAQPPLDVAKANFEAQADILAENGVDLFVLEMMRDVTYTHIVLQAAARTGLPVWVGFSLNPDSKGAMHLFDNPTETLADGVKSIVNTAGSLVSIMHSLTEHTLPALQIIKANWSGPIGAYPHSGAFVMPNWQFNNVISPQAYAEQALQWVALGAQVIGGCCGIGPAHIRLLKETLPTHLK